MDGTVHYVPHGLIQTSSNLTRTWAGINLDVPVPYEEDLQRMVAAIDEAGQTLTADSAWARRVVEAPRVVRVERLAEQGLVLKVLGSVGASHRYAATGELRRRIVEICEREGLTLGWRAVSPPAKGRKN
jgi:moderate conductance mechanosensitive channel